MMNVLYILNSTYILGGASKSFIIMIKGLMKKGISPIVVLPDRNGIYSELIDMDVEIIVLTYRINTYPHLSSLKDFFLFFPRLLARRWVNYRAVCCLTDILHGRKIKLIHTNVSVVDIGFRLSKALHIPHIYHIREYGNLDFHEHYYPSWGAFHKTLFGLQSYAICITKGILLHHHLQDCLNAKVIYNGITGVVPNEECNEKEDYFLYAGRVETAKGLDILLEAYWRYWQESMKKTPLWIAGNRGRDTYNHDLDKFISNHGLNEYVRFLGARTDIYELMKRAKAIVIPSRWEAFGRCMAEAMFNKCLVIGYNTGGTKEQFDNGRHLTGTEIGFRFASVEELVLILKKMDTSLLDDCSELLNRAFYTVCTLYSEDACVDNIYNFYSNIVNENVD